MEGDSGGGRVVVGGWSQVGSPQIRLASLGEDMHALV